MAKRKNEIGVCTEHTAAHVVLPRLTTKLAAYYPHGLSVFFSPSREGSRVAMEIGYDDPISIVAVFPRRPKVLYGGDAEIVIKINRELFMYAEHAEPFGIPVFAGVPVVSSLFELACDPLVAWFTISPSEAADDQFVRLDRAQGRVVLVARSSDDIVGPLESEEVATLVRSHTTSTTWGEAVHSLSVIRRETYGWGYPPFAGYKPYVVLLWS
jgi:hypothetical protein